MEQPKVAKKEDQSGTPVYHQEASEEYMDDKKSVTESGSTSTSPLPTASFSNPRKLKLLKAERKLKQITKTYTSQLSAAKTDPNEEPKLELIKSRMTLVFVLKG